ncbi:YitT family protein [Lutispora saccharofermentans]|uniref:YitT family protein n=1 Tax=Lutispora saccharofermentans TaxID=3024236 RepID=A0ABT1NIF5_9FIRM|nr:YitT family protein [Lutispora saccharofermentans]MCQ1531055.1 YitT family protein [Lutispora saccharofermentans]
MNYIDRLYSSKFKYLIMMVFILLGGAISGISFNAFIMPHKLLSGGVSGIALIINYLTGISPGLLIFVINIPVFLLGYKFVDKEFIILSLIGMSSLSFFIDAFSFLRGMHIIDDIMLSSIYGGILNGIGMGIVFRNRASQGGIDIIAVIIKKYMSINIGSTSLTINFIIVTIASFIYGLKPALYTLITMYIASQVLDKVQQGFDIRKQVMIISDKEDEVVKEIIKRLHRGVTYLDGEGAFTGNKKRVIYCIVTLNQLAKLKQIVREIDSKAFMAVSNTAEVLGRGFSKRGV